MKKWIFAVVAVMLLFNLSGCDVEWKSAKKNTNIANHSTIDSDIAVSESREKKHIEGCIEIAKDIASGEIELSEYGGNPECLKHYVLQEDGNGFAIFEAYGGGVANGFAYCDAYRTEDGGRTWMRNPEIFIFNKGPSEIYAWDNYVMLISPGDTAESTSILLSNDYGKSFESKAIKEILRFDIERKLTIKCTVLYRGEGRIRLGWYGYWDDNRRYFCIEDYDYELNFIERYFCDEKMMYLGVQIKQFDQTGFVFIDSDKRYLSEAEVEKLIELEELQYEYGMVYNKGEEEWLRVAINEIYARKGYDFSGTSYEYHFEGYEWYKQIEKKVVEEKDLNQYEKYNIDLLVRYEKELKEAKEERIY